MRSGHVVCDGEGLLISVDRGFATIMQADLPDLIGRPVLELTAPADRHECGCAIARLCATRTPFELSKRFIRDDGSLVWVTNHVSMVGDGGDGDMIVATVVPILDPDSPRAPARLLECARVLADVRDDRSSVFDRSLFSDTAWDAILAAYIAEAEGRAITVATLADRLAIPITRADRWISVLIGHGAIEIETRESDAYAPKSFRLTGQAHVRLEQHLGRAGEVLRATRRSAA